MTRKRGRPKIEIAAERDIRADLRNAAINLFAQKGFAKVSLAEIASEAGVTVGLIRHYFGSKDGLIAECNDAVVDRLKSIFHAILENFEPKNGAEFVERLQERVVNVLAPERNLLFYLKHLTNEHPPAANVAFREYFMLLQQELNRLEACGHLRNDANKVWMTFFVMFIQMGPVFLADQIEAIVGRAAHDPGAIKERGRENTNILKFGILPRMSPDTK